MNKKKYYGGLIPFEKEGSTRHSYDREGEYSIAGWPKNYTRENAPEEPGVTEYTEWRRNKPFTAKMQVVTFERGRSSVNFILEDLDGKRYYITLNELFGLIKTLEKGWIGNTDWIYAKKGSAYSVIPYEHED
jgi:hypothetical protein